MKRILLLLTMLAPLLPAAEETGFSWPLGPLGGKMRLWTAEKFVRVSELTPGAPGAVAGLQVNDFIMGAFGRDFDALGPDFEGVVRQLGNAIEHAESNDGVLPLRVLRPGAGWVTVTVNLPAIGALDPAYPLTSAKYAATYEHACAQLHARVMADGDGDLGYPTGFTGLALLGHPHWADETGAKPYRLSINRIRDHFVARINGAVYAPVEDLLLDHPTTPSANPNFVANPVGLESWTLGQAVMFLAEYQAKTGDASHAAVLQRGAELMANRVQYWKQPPQHANGYSPEYGFVRGMTSHGGVTGDYMHMGWGGGINMTGVHLFNGLALAKRAGVDMSVRPRDGHYFGFNLNPGDPIPASIASALPASIELPRIGGAAPVTVNNAFYYDLSLEEKFWMKWDFLVRSSGSNGHVTYGPAAGAEYDAGGRTPAAMFGIMAYHGGTPLSGADQALVDAKKNYIIAAHDRHLNAHAYNMGGGLFTALVMPWFGDRDQRFFWDNWKFYANFMRRPDGSLAYFRGRGFGDAYQDESLVVLVNNALPRSVALGGLPHVPGYATDRVFARFKQPLLEWPSPEARKRRITGNSESFTVDLIDSSGATIPPGQVSAAWSVVSGPATSGIFSSTGTLNTTATFPQPGTYRLKLDASANSLSTSETIDILVMPDVGPGYAAGEADYRVYTGITGNTVASLTSSPAYPASPARSGTISSLEGTYSGGDYGSTITTTIVAPETGVYRFYIASDDESSLLFNAAGAGEAGAVQIASVTGWTSARQWNKYGSQQSAAISLTAGQHYFIKALHKEGGGGDHLAIGWTTPSNSSIAVIDAPYLARPVATVAAEILDHPQSVTANLGDAVSFSLNTRGSEPSFYQWRLNGVDFGAPQATPTLSLSNIGARLAGRWDCVFTCGGTVLTSNEATLTINGMGILASGGLWQEVFTGVTGGTVDALLAHASYPNLSTSSGVLASPSTGTLGDDYGQRWSGWLVPETSGRYRFYAAADDATRLYLSPDEYESHKRLIHSITSYTGALSWSSRAPSDWVTLEAGRRYFVEFFHAEGGGGDHAAFTWQKEGDPVPANGGGLIPSNLLQPATGGTLPDAATAPPVAFDDSTTVVAGEPAILSPLANDADAAPASLEIIAVTAPAVGGLSITPDGRGLRFESSLGDSGTVNATYTVRNAIGLTDTATVTMQLAADVPRDLVVHLPLDANADDSSGRNHHGSPGGSPVHVAGRIGGAIQLDSAAKHVSLGTPADLDFGSATNFTVAFWIKSTGWGSGNDPVFLTNKSWSSGSNTGWLIAGQTDGAKWQWNWRAAGSTRADFETGGTLTDGKWHHIAVTHDRAGDATFYHDGVPIGSVPLAAKTGSITSGLPTVVGNDANRTYPDSPNAAIDDVGIWSRVLAPEEIAALHGSGGTFQTPWGTWRGVHFGNDSAINGPLHDPDKDGIENLLEYALDLDPNAGNALAQKVSADLETIAADRFLRLTVHKNPDATDLRYFIEACGDMAAWSGAGIVIEQDTPALLQARDGQTVGGAPSRFMRLRVTKE